MGLSVATLPSGRAADIYWDLNGATDGSGVAAGSTNPWSTSATNWSIDSTGLSTTAVWTNGDSAIFSAGVDAAGQFNVTNGGITVDNITQEEGRVRITSGTLTLADTAITINAQTRVSGDYDFRIDSIIADSGSGASSITKSGSGILMLTATNTYSGGFTLADGTVTIEGNGGVFGTGTLTLNNGNFTKSWGSGSTAVTVANALNVTGSVNIGVIQGQAGNLILSGAWSAGNSNSVFNVPNTAINGLNILSSTINVSGNISAYTGTFSHNTLGTGGNRLRFGANNAGSIIHDASKAKFLTSGSTTGSNCIDLADGAYGTFKMGELAGAGGVVRGGWSAGGNTTFEVGALNTHSQFGGHLQDNINGAGGRTALGKVGGGTLELALSSGNTYSNGTTVSEGTLLVGNTTGSATGTGPVSVSSAGTLGGAGRIAPSDANGISVSGALAPGGFVSGITGGTLTSDIGQLTVDLGNTSGTISMLSGASFKFELGTANTSLGSIAFGSSDLFTLTGASIGDLLFASNTMNFLGTGEAGFYKLLDTDWDETTWSGLAFDGVTGIVTAGLTSTNLAPGLTGSFIVGTISNGADGVGDIYLQVQAVPEPGAGLAFVGGIGALALIRRRRLQVS